MRPSAAASRPTSLLLAGGGLANSLIAYRLVQQRSDVDVVLVEGGSRIGAKHTWSFFSSDLPEESHWIAPFVVRSWDEYEVRFPRRRRRIPNGYRSVTAERLHDEIMKTLGDRVVLEAPIRALDASGADLDDGRRLDADLTIDGRGPTAMPDLVLGYQKFIGLTVSLREAHGLKGPIIMDAPVDLRDGYRFIYVLPWDERTVLIEDTRYSDGATHDQAEIRAAICDYAKAQNWTIEAILAEEEGILPLALDGDIEAHWRRADGRALSGLRAVLFHPTTGYSLPDALALANAICALPRLDLPTVEALIRTRSIDLWNSRGVFRLVNRMLFRAAVPDQRYRVLERFYGLPEPLIRRFYAANLTGFDKVRLLAGKPPVPFGAALHCIKEKGAA